MQLTSAVDESDRYLELDELYQASALFSFVQVDDETMLVTRGVGTNRIKVRRGESGSTAATHANGAAVTVPTSTHTHPTYLTGD